MKNIIKRENVGILGYGEVGKAIAKFYKNPKIKDLKRDDNLKGVEVLNVCIFYNDNFVKIVKQEIEKIKPKLTIVHSTTAPGTIKNLGGMVVHSPVRGVHPELYEGVKTFVKYIGADNEEAGQMAKKHLEELGIRTKLFMPSLTTELGKLFSTTYYGLCIAWHGEMKRICDKEGVDFEKAVTNFNETYNEGYEKLGKDNVVRPVLYPPEEGCGGHCIIENTILLRKSFPKFSEFFDFILGMGKNISSVSQRDKPYVDEAWLYGEYWGRDKSSEEIAKEWNCTGANILQLMRRRGIPTRDFKWTDEQIKKILKLSEEGKSFKEISEDFSGEKTYNAIRNIAYKMLKIKSSYDPAEETRRPEVRKKISATLQGIELEDWEEFKLTLNALIRKSVEYQKWREKVFERDNHTCQKCKERGGYLIAHHITNFSDNPGLRMELENGITLCKKHHLEFHNKYGRENNSREQLENYLLN